MSAATVLTSAMSEMPALSGSGGSLASLIRYIAPILGWSIEFDNSTDIIVIKPQSYGGGQALFYRIDDRAARGGAAPRVAEVRAYESMSDINTGAGLVGPGYIHKSYYANTTGYLYTIAGDQYGFFLNSNLYKSAFETTPTALSYRGFLNRLRDTDAPVCAVFGDSADGVSLGSFMVYQAPPATTGKAGLFVHKSKEVVLNTKVALRSGGVFEIEGHGIGAVNLGTSFTVYKPLPEDEVIAAPIYVNNGSAYSIQYVLPAVSLQSKLSTGYNATLLGFNGLSINQGYDVGKLAVPLDGSFRP